MRALECTFLLLAVLSSCSSSDDVKLNFGFKDIEEFVKELELAVDISNSTEFQFEPVAKVSGVLVDNDNITDTDIVQGREDLGDEEDAIAMLRDLSDLNEDFAADVSAGVEESLKLLLGFKGNESEDGPETRQMPMYMFQGQYVSEPRLNRFIDGAIRNMGDEVRSSSMDPIYFRVLPQGRLQQRGKPVQVQKIKTRVQRRRPGGAGVGAGRKKRQTENSTLEVTGRLLGIKKRRRAQAQLLIQKRRRAAKLQAARRRRQRQKNRRRKNQGLFNVGVVANQNKKQNLKNKRRRQKQSVLKLKRRRQNQNAKNRRKRTFANRNVGGGRVEGLSRVVRDGDAEMQLFGNYTLIRSHMKIGPVELTMQMKTRKGIRRTGATLPVLRAHTVTRVNHEGSEMVDFLLDRPHPETIQLRGNLFPMARKLAKNIFSRLFLPDSFLIQKMREKTGLSLLSKPTIQRALTLTL